MYKLLSSYRKSLSVPWKSTAGLSTQTSPSDLESCYFGCPVWEQRPLLSSNSSFLSDWWERRQLRHWSGTWSCRVPPFSGLHQPRHTCRQLLHLRLRQHCPPVWPLLFLSVRLLLIQECDQCPVPTNLEFMQSVLVISLLSWSDMFVKSPKTEKWLKHFSNWYEL